MADTDENEAEVGRTPSDLRHVDDTLAFLDSRGPRHLLSGTHLTWVNDAEARKTDPGRFSVTRDHDVIRTWAEGLHGKPAILKSGAGGNVAEALRFQVTDRLRSEYQTTSWEEWFGYFDRADLVFIFQERADDGSVSDVFRIAPAAVVKSGSGAGGTAGLKTPR